MPGRLGHYWATDFEASCGARGPGEVSASADTIGLVPERLYRSMRTARDGRPDTGPTARTLGVRVGVDIPVDVDDVVVGGGGGMSVAPDSPLHLPEHRRPPSYGGTGKDPVWELDLADLGDRLVYREDPLMPGVHGFIEPRVPMQFAEFESALLATRQGWRLP